MRFIKNQGQKRTTSRVARHGDRLSIIRFHLPIWEYPAHSLIVAHHTPFYPLGARVSSPVPPPPASKGR
jgi:hypothetical protein